MSDKFIGENVAFKCKVTTNSTTYLNYTINKINNGNISNSDGYLTDCIPPSTPITITLDLNKSYKILYVNLKQLICNSYRRCKEFEIQASNDDLNYISIITSTLENNDNMQQFKLPSNIENYRYWHFIIKNDYSGADKGICEIELLKEVDENSPLIYFNGTNYHDGSNADTLDSLLDDNTHKKTNYGVLVTTNKESHFYFNLMKKSNIYAYGELCSDSGGSTGKKIKLYKINNDDTETFIKEIQTKNNEWYLLCDNLGKGKYRFKVESNANNYCSFTEFNVKPCQIYLLNKNNQYYTIKDNELILLENQNLNKENFKLNGFDDLNMLENIDKNDLELLIYLEDYNKDFNIKYTLNEIETPINDLKKLNNGCFNFYLKEVRNGSSKYF